MAQAIMVVCDECGEPAVDTISFRRAGAAQSRQKDLCAKHLAAVEHGSRAAKRGRPPAKGGPVAAGKRTTTRKGTRRRKAKS